MQTTAAGDMEQALQGALLGQPMWQGVPTSISDIP